MNTPTRLGAFALCLTATFGLAAGVGAAVGPLGATSTQTRDAEHPDPPAPVHDVDDLPGPTSTPRP